MLTFPLSLADFFNKLYKAEVSMHPPGASQFMETRAGEIIPVKNGTRLWMGSIEHIDGLHAELDKVAAIVEYLLESDGSFLVTQSTRVATIYDPTGSIIGNTTPTIASVSSDNRQVNFSGMPNNYVLQAGDLFSFTYGTPTRYAMHRVVQGGTAGSGGNLNNVLVTPSIRPGAVGRSINLKNPRCKAIIKPNSLRPARQRGSITSGFSFDWTQTLR